MLLKGKVALITGAARGIGRATAMIMAGEGADVGLVDILPEVDATAGQIREKGRRSAAAIFDIADPEQVQLGMRKIRKELGDIDILVNNAGIVNNIAPLVKMTHEAWSREIAVNLSGAFNMIKAVIGPMIEKKWGRIINFSSLGATGGLHFQIGYASSKAGLLGLTKTVALEHAGDGITCNAVVPGLIGTELVHQMPEEIKKSVLTNIPARRFGKMEEVSHLVAFLASDRAGYINGEEIHIDGGMRLNVSTLGSRKALKDRGSV
ncbi:MAG: SDR family oxidoreductase [Desulfobacterales bacterium]|nr:MAG: SDR family oxidoreductase [Desulfobacterales bacterium]